jgi:hypothetical protein
LFTDHFFRGAFFLTINGKVLFNLFQNGLGLDSSYLNMASRTDYILKT